MAVRYPAHGRFMFMAIYSLTIEGKVSAEPTDKVLIQIFCRFVPTDRKYNDDFHYHRSGTGKKDNLKP